MGFALIFYVFAFVMSTDIQAHTNCVLEFALGKKPIPTNFLYYLSVYLLSFCSKNINVLLIFSVILLTTTTFFKYYITKTIFCNELAVKTNSEIIIANFSAAFCIAAFSLPLTYFLTHNYYVLTFTPNIWHNSTTIFAMPFVLLLFWISQRQLQEFSKKRLMLIAVLIVINIFIKPSFVFVFMVIYPLFLLKNNGLFTKLFWINLLPLVAAILLVFVQYTLIYTNSQDSGNSVGISPFYLFKQFSKGYNAQFVIVLSTIASFFFPIVVLLKNKHLLKKDIVLYTVSLVIFAIIIACTLVETGSRKSSGNFFWQIFMCSYILFFVCILELLKLLKTNNYHYKKYRFEIIALFAHVLSGFLYFVKITLTSSYY